MYETDHLKDELRECIARVHQAMYEAFDDPNNVVIDGEVVRTIVLDAGLMRRIERARVLTDEDYLDIGSGMESLEAIADVRMDAKRMRDYLPLLTSEENDRYALVNERSACDETRDPDALCKDSSPDEVNCLDCANAWYWREACEKDEFAEAIDDAEREGMRLFVGKVR